MAAKMNAEKRGTEKPGPSQNDNKMMTDNIHFRARSGKALGEVQKLARSEELRGEVRKLVAQSNVPSSAECSSTVKNRKRAKASRMHIVLASQLPFRLKSEVKPAIQIVLPEIPTGVVDIVKIPLLASNPHDLHYGREIIFYMKQLENAKKLPDNYLAADGTWSINSKVRAILFDWLVQVQSYKDLSDETLHMTVKIIDAFFASKYKLHSNQVQLVGIASLFIACKFVERFPPKIASLIHLTEDSYSKIEVVQMEQLILNRLKFSLNFPNPVIFVDHLFHLSGAQHTQLLFLSKLFVDMMLPNPEMAHVLPSQLSAASFCLAKKVLYRGDEAEWNVDYQFYSGYEEEELRHLMRLFAAEVVNREKSPYEGTWMKYSSRSKYQQLACRSFLCKQNMHQFLFV